MGRLVKTDASFGMEFVILLLEFFFRNFNFYHYHYLWFSKKYNSRVGNVYLNVYNSRKAQQHSPFIVASWYHSNSNGKYIGYFVRK